MTDQKIGNVIFAAQVDSAGFFYEIKGFDINI
jgi:hypothetical protein